VINLSNFRYDLQFYTPFKKNSIFYDTSLHITLNATENVCSECIHTDYEWTMGYQRNMSKPDPVCTASIMCIQG